MKPVKLRVVIGFALVGVSTAMLVWGFWPVNMVQHIVPITASDLQLPPEAVEPDQPGSPLVFTEALELVTEWPAAIRAGDSAPIRMDILPAGKIQGSDQASRYLDQSPASTSANPGQNNHYQAVAQGRLEFTGLEYEPDGVINEALLPGQEVRFRWEVRPQKTGLISGTLWLHFRYLSRNGAEAARKVIAAQKLEIQSRKFLGLSGNTARFFGSIGLVVGAMVALDFFTLVSDKLSSSKPGSQTGVN